MNSAVTDQGPFFFLSYSQTPERPWVEKLFRDLQLEVLERTDLPVDSQVGFMDTNTVSLGGLWRDEIARALATCNVFIPLLCPRYFTSEECGMEWHAFVQRVLDHQAYHPGEASFIVPALWTPVKLAEVPEVARRIQIHHADQGEEYAEHGLYTLIKNSYYKQQYQTAVQRLAVHIIRAVEKGGPRPWQVRQLEQRRNAFKEPLRRAPADRRLNVIVVASTHASIPEGRSGKFYGHTATEWNPYHPASQLVIADFAATVARQYGYEPTVMGFDEGAELVARDDAEAGLGLLLLDAWAVLDADLAARLSQLDRVSGWVAVMVPWNRDDPQTRCRSQELWQRLTELLPHRLGTGRPFSPVNARSIGTLEQFRNRLPDALEGALNGYLNHADAHRPSGSIPARPLLRRFTE